jgi:hypothetical protein
MHVFTRTIKDAVRDFGAQPDDATDNYPAALMAAGWMAWGGHVEWPRGGYRFSSFPAIGANNGGMIGEGMGRDLYPHEITGSHGTCFRHTGQGDFLIFDGADDLLVRDLSMWPVLHKDSGAEIRIKNRGRNLRFERIRGVMPNIFAHVENGVWNKFTDCHAFDPFGKAAWYITGAPDNSAANEETILSGCTSYTSHNIYDMVEASTLADRANNAPVTAGHYRRFTWGIAQCVVGGTTGPSEPALPAYVYSQDRSYQQITDGTAKFVFLCKPDLAGVLVDSGGNYVQIRDVCKFLEGVHAVKAVNTFPGGTKPKVIDIDSLQVDHNAGDSLRLETASEIRVAPGVKIDSARGRPYYLGPTCDKFSVLPWHQNCDLPPLNEAGDGPWKQCGALLPDYGDLTRGELGHSRIDTNWGVNQTLVRKIGGVDHQWHFGLRSDGKFELRKDLPAPAQEWIWPP